MSKFAKLRTAVIILIFTALTVPLAKADTMDVPLFYTLTLTEISDTQLIATYDGPGGNSAFPVTNTGIDTWTVDVASSVIFFDKDTGWIEPENPLEVNRVLYDFIADRDHMFVTSDLSNFGGVVLPNNTGQDAGINGSDDHTVVIVFNDLASATETAAGVPDTGSSLSFLAMSVAGLIGLSRFRRSRISQLA